MSKITTTRLISIPKFARRAGVNATVVRNAVANGQVPFVRIGQRKLIPEDAVERLLTAATNSSK